MMQKIYDFIGLHSMKHDNHIRFLLCFTFWGRIVLINKHTR